MTRIALSHTFIFLTALGKATADSIWNLPESHASAGALRYQPALDWDDDTCYHTAAIEPSGKTNPGLVPNSDESQCREKNRLDYGNVYAREVCNQGWCVYMYGYYSEMDWSRWSSHRHDWEHAMVWTRGADVWSVMWSAHGEYDDADPRDVYWQGDHPKLVAHHGTAMTGSLRRAKGSDKKPENVLGTWVTSPLQEYTYVDDKVWAALVGTDWGNAHMDLKDGRFQDMLKLYMPKKAREEGFVV